MAAVVAQLEAAIEAASLPVVPRASMQSFHVPIGTTDDATYPMATALTAILRPSRTWRRPFTFSFFLPIPHTVRAHAHAGAGTAAAGSARATRR